MAVFCLHKVGLERPDLCCEQGAPVHQWQCIGIALEGQLSYFVPIINCSNHTTTTLLPSTLHPTTTTTFEFEVMMLSYVQCTLYKYFVYVL